MREIDPALQAKLDSGATTLCRCWRINRRDGISAGFTDHDRDLAFDGLVFAAGTGLDAAALESSTGLSVDNSQAIGALSAAGLTEADIHAGRYDGAEVYHWLVDWTEPSLRVLLFRGSLGEIRRGANAFEAELRGLSEQLNRTVGRTYMGSCDRVLGDGKCGFDLSAPGYTVAATVATVTDRRRFTVGGLSGIAENWFTHGQGLWTSGANAGVASDVKFDLLPGLDRSVELWVETPADIVSGDQVTLVAGCDKTPETCKGKFLNFLNFRGFPHIPGEDWAHAYPAQGGDHDGTSRNG